MEEGILHGVISAEAVLSGNLETRGNLTGTISLLTTENTEDYATQEDILSLFTNIGDEAHG